jgi:amino acid transporter
VTRGLGQRVGTAAGWLYYGGVTILLAGLLLLIGGYLESTIQGEFKVDPLPSWAWTVLLIALIAGILYFGVRISTRSQLALALVSMLVVGVFFIFVIVKLGSANSAKAFNPSSAADGWSGIFFGVLYGVLMFVGFETAANLAEETPNPRREIPIAVMATARSPRSGTSSQRTSRWPASDSASKPSPPLRERPCSRSALRQARAGSVAPGSTACSSSSSCST